jgi:hypothetical protein
VLRPSRIAAVLALSALVLVGCGEGDGGTPVACLEGEAAYLTALEGAPGEVLVGGEEPISGCLVENQTPGDIGTVGVAMIGAATGLNAEARKDPGGEANLRLGYLLGAAQRGAESTEGIHADLIRRLAVAARYSPGRQLLPPEFLRTYRRGFDAGRAEG